jgi:hypothetical protein
VDGVLALKIGTTQDTLDGDQWDCHTGDSGTYQLTLSRDGQTLTMTGTADDCSTREGILAGSWTRWPCKLNYGGYAYCPHLDEQAVGRHMSPVFKPFSAGASGQFAWTAPDTGWVTLSKPPTWPQLDTPTETWLWRPGPPNSGVSVVNAVGVFSDLVASPERAVSVASALTPTCSDGARADGGTAKAAADWLGSLPYLIVSNRTLVTIGGLHGVQLDVALVGGFVDLCSTASPSPDDVVESSHSIKIFDDPEDALKGIYLNRANSGHAPSTAPAARLILLDAGDPNRILVIEIPAPASNPSTNPLIAEAMPVINSFEFIR